MVGIIPKKISKADFCGSDDYYYIVRTDLNCYMKSTNFNEGLDLGVFSLHPSCRDGDHYLAHEDRLFYIIKSGFYRRVSNMHEDAGSMVYSLHPKCQGGDHYLSAFGCFYIIFQSKGVYRTTTNLNSNDNAKEYPLHKECGNGLYYWGMKDHYYFVKPYDQWGLQYVKCTNFNTHENAKTWSFHESVMNFLPGGLSISKGPAYGEWVCIKSIKNDSASAVNWQKKITRKSGYVKEVGNSLEHNWKVSSTVSAETGSLGKVIAKSSLSLTAEYGGCSVSTEKENWSEATEIEETITCNLKPQEAIYVYVYVLGIGGKPVLHCRDMRVLSSPTPPTDNPLPPATK